MRKTVLMMLALVLLFTGCTNTEAPKTSSTPSTTPKETTESTPSPTASPIESEQENEKLTEKAENEMIEIELQNGKIMTAELYPEIAPITVANFLKLVDQKFYDGLIFHRVIPGFMIQGGGFDTNNNQKHAESIKGEFTNNGVENNLKHTRGILSMARTPLPDSASSQFFVMVADSPHLDNEYAAFGKVISGMESADEIVNQPKDGQDKPLKDQIIKTIRRK